MILSTLTILAATSFLIGLPVWLVYPKFRAGHLHLVLAVSGLYVTLAYLKPAGVSIWLLPALVLFIAHSAKGFLPSIKKDPFFSFAKDKAFWAITIYATLVFLLRWEAPGNDSTKWAALARLFLFNDQIPGDLRPLSLVEDLKGANMGLPVLIALVKALSGADFARVTNFFSCFSVACFIFSMAEALSTWFENRISRWAAFGALVLFTNPVQFLSWGGTPTLMGLTGGLSLLSWVHAQKDKLRFNDSIPYALAIVFAAHSHAVGIYVSILVFLPLVLYLGFQSKNASILIRTGIKFGLLTALLFSPFLLHWGMNATHSQLMEAKDWQAKMSPILFREGHFFLINLMSQLYSYVWETAGIMLTLVLGWILVQDRKQPFLVPAGILFLVIAILVANARFWILPLSYLIYPERTATLLAFPFSMTLAWLLERALNSTRKYQAAFLVVFLAFGLHQFHKRLFPVLTTTTLPKEDREVFKYIEQSVSLDDCIEITEHLGGMWIGAETGHCHYPRHPFGFNTIDADRTRPPQGLKWRFYSILEEKTPIIKGRVIFENGARLVVQESQPQ